VLNNELENKGINKQYLEHTLPLLCRLADLEYQGLSVDVAKLTNIREALVDSAVSKGSLCAVVDPVLICRDKG